MKGNDMRVKIFLMAWALFFSSSVFALENGSELFDKLCVICHVKEGKPGNAPPIFAVVNHVKGAYPNKQEFVQKITSWVNEPKEASALMPGAIRKFGLMPAMGYSESDVRLIAEFLYDGNTDLPEWYIKHYEQEHGKVPTQ